MKPTHPSAVPPDHPEKRRRIQLRRNRRLQGLCLAASLALLAVLLTLANLFAPDRAFSEQENRKLAGFPVFSLQRLADGSYFADLEKYTADQFVGRDMWISLRLRAGRLLGQKESNGVLLCRDHYLMELPAAADTKNVSRNLSAINSFAAQHPELNMYLTVAPNAVSILQDKLPRNAQIPDQRQQLQDLRSGLAGVQFMDVTEALSAHSNEPLYYRTDHHWTTRGAYRAFEAMAPQMGIDDPITDYEIYTVSERFEGTLASKSGSHGVCDSIEIYAPKTQTEYYVEYPDSQKTVCSMYQRDCLEQKDQYTVFFGGNHPRVDVVTTAQTGRSLLLLKDSYANCFVPFLMPYFDRIIMIDPRYYYDSAEALLARYEITDVLFLYNASTYFTDHSLADVLTP